MTNRLIITIFLMLICPSLILAGEYHQNDQLSCSDCHTQHYSERGAVPEGAEPGGPFPRMLLVSSTNKLCLSCHDGTDPTAPDVLAPVTMYDGSGSEYSGAGFFTGIDGVASSLGHDLGVENQVPYAIPPRGAILSCASCHNPHGSTNYRNLSSNPDSSGVSVDVLLGTDVFENLHPADPPNRGATIDAYKQGNLGNKGKMAEWCADCHSNLLPNLTGNPPAHFLRHPSDASMGDNGYHVDIDHWLGGTGDGFGNITGDLIEGVPRLRFQAPNSIDYNSSTLVNSDNQVFCYSCHFAHGGPYDSSLKWPFKNPGQPDLYSGCEQCHYK